MHSSMVCLMLEPVLSCIEYVSPDDDLKAGLS